MTWYGNRQPQPYQRAPVMVMPVDPPEPPADPPKVKRADGSECDLLATIGVSRRGPVAPDDRVHDWRPI